MSAADAVARWFSSLVSQTSMAGQPAAAQAATSSANGAAIVVASLMHGFMSGRRAAVAGQRSFKLPDHVLLLLGLDRPGPQLADLGDRLVR